MTVEDMCYFATLTVLINHSTIDVYAVVVMFVVRDVHVEIVQK